MTDEEMMDAILNAPFVFWTCPKGCRGFVDWNDEKTEAVCRECGTKSTERKVMTISGLVIRKKVAPGSKSEREAVCLKTNDKEFILRRKGGNPFSDPQLEQLVGKTVKCEGTVHNQHFIADEINPDD